MAAVTQRWPAGGTTATDQDRCFLVEFQQAGHPAGAEMGTIAERSLAAPATGAKGMGPGPEGEGNRADGGAG